MEYRKRIVLKDFAGEQTPAGTQFDDREFLRQNTKRLCHLGEFSCEQFAEDRIEIGRRVEVALPANGIAGRSVVTEIGMVERFLHEVAKGNGAFLLDSWTGDAERAEKDWSLGHPDSRTLDRYI